jgi:Surface antigen variable number repeat
MARSAVLAGAVLLLIAPALHAQQPPPPPQPVAPPVRNVRIIGAKDLPEADARAAMNVAIGEPLAGSPERVAEKVERHYHDAGYTFARVSAAFEAPTGTLTLTIDEGVIDGVEFEGVDDRIARTFAEDFALRSGDVFNRNRAMEALDALLRPTRGAVSPGRADDGAATTSAGATDLRRRSGAFDLIERNGQRILRVGLSEPSGRFKLVPDLGEREDWFTPVDGFVPSLGFGAAVFDHNHFNHAYVAGHLSFKTASDAVGYALGFERPFFTTTKLYVGVELHDLTASDDQWQISGGEASFAAFGARRSYRDYYRRRGVQVSGALRVHPQVELLMAWRGERHEHLNVESDFSLWGGDDPFRPNLFATEGRLNAVVIGASVDGRSFDRESLEATYRRHQLETPFGERLQSPEGKHDDQPIWRVDWTSEISTPGGLGSDFDFRRHIVSGRARVPLSPHQDFGARVIGGWSDGVLPPQRQFAIGGLGSVHGYGFKEAVGSSLALVNLEYGIGWRHGPRLFGLFDAGRVTSPTSVDAPWLKGVGVGLGAGGIRLDFGYKLDQIPSSLQVTVRFGRTF